MIGTFCLTAYFDIDMDLKVTCDIRAEGLSYMHQLCTEILVDADPFDTDVVLIAGHFVVDNKSTGSN